jgi:hypothetical protein
MRFIENSVCLLKGFWLALRLSRLTRDEINEWFDSHEHHSELAAIVPPELAVHVGERPDSGSAARPGIEASLSDTAFGIAFKRSAGSSPGRFRAAGRTVQYSN